MKTSTRSTSTFARKYASPYAIKLQTPRQTRQLLPVVSTAVAIIKKEPVSLVSDVSGVITCEGKTVTVKNGRKSTAFEFDEIYDGSNRSELMAHILSEKNHRTIVIAHGPTATGKTTFIKEAIHLLLKTVPTCRIAVLQIKGKEIVNPVKKVRICKAPFIDEESWFDATPEIFEDFSRDFMFGSNTATTVNNTNSSRGHTAIVLSSKSEKRNSYIFLDFCGEEGPDTEVPGDKNGAARINTDSFVIRRFFCSLKEGLVIAPTTAIGKVLKFLYAFDPAESEPPEHHLKVVFAVTLSARSNPFTACNCCQACVGAKRISVLEIPAKRYQPQYESKIICEKSAVCGEGKTGCKYKQLMPKSVDEKYVTASTCYDPAIHNVNPTIKTQGENKENIFTSSLTPDRHEKPSERNCGIPFENNTSQAIKANSQAETFCNNLKKWESKPQTEDHILQPKTGYENLGRQVTEQSEFADAFAALKQLKNCVEEMTLKSSRDCKFCTREQKGRQTNEEISKIAPEPIIVKPEEEKQAADKKAGIVKTAKVNKLHTKIVNALQLAAIFCMLVVVEAGIVVA